MAKASQVQVCVLLYCILSSLLCSRFCQRCMLQIMMVWDCCGLYKLLNMQLSADQHAHSQDTARTHESFAAQSSWPHPFGSFEEYDVQQSPSGNSRQAVTDGSNGSALGDVRDWQPPRQELGRFVPPGLVCYQRSIWYYLQRLTSSPSAIGLVPSAANCIIYAM